VSCWERHADHVSRVASERPCACAVLRLPRSTSSNVPPPQHGGDVQGRRHPRRRLAHDHRLVHCQPRHGQADAGARHHLVLPVRVGGRHAGRGRHCQVLPRRVRDAEQPAADDAGGGVGLPGPVLHQQGPPHVCVQRRAPRRVSPLSAGPRLR
jgi:hypothetical protein